MMGMRFLVFLHLLFISLSSYVSRGVTTDVIRAEYEFWESHADIKQVLLSQNCSWLVDVLGCAMETNLHVGMTYMGYVFVPADAAYTRLLELRPSYTTLYSRFTVEISRGNVLRLTLLARLLFRLYPDKFTGDICSTIRDQKCSEKRFLVWRACEEAVWQRTVLNSYGRPSEKHDESFKKNALKLVTCIRDANVLPATIETNTPFYGELWETNEYPKRTSQCLDTFLTNLECGNVPYETTQ